MIHRHSINSNMQKSYPEIVQQRVKNLKYTIFFFNILKWVIAFTLLLLLLWFNFNSSIQRNIEVADLGYIYIGVYILIITALLGLIVAVFGCIVSLSLNSNGLNALVLSQVAIFVITLIGCGLLLSYDINFHSFVEDRFNTLLVESGSTLESKIQVDDTQRIVGCCGINGIEDFSHYGLMVPVSCREPKTGNAYYYGCIDVLTWFFESKTQIIAWIAIGMCLTNVFDSISRTMKHFVYGCLITGVCFLCYWNSLSCGFVFDDISAIKDNRDLRPHTSISNLFFNDFWGTLMLKEQSHKSYRPLCVLTFRWNYYYHQLEPFGYHFINILLHAAVCVLYFRLLNVTLLLNEVCSFIASILFAVHPIHTEAVTGVVGRAETLSSVFFLIAFIFYTKATKLRKRTNWMLMVISVISITTAMLCKEQGITISAICFVYEIFANQKIRVYDLLKLLIQYFPNDKKYRNYIQSVPSSPTSNNQLKNGEFLKRLSTLTLLVILLLILRMRIMGSQLPVFTRFDNPASVSETPVRQLTYNYLVALNFWLLLFPCHLCCDWTMGTIPLVESVFDTRNLLTVLTYCLFGYLIYVALTTKQSHKSVILITGLSFMVLPFVPASNLFFPVGFVIAERVLYMPSMGYCLLVAYGLNLVWDQSEKRKLISLCFILLTVSHILKTYTRNLDWKDEYTIFMAGLRVNQRNAKLFNNVGHALESQSNYEEALKYFITAVGVQPDDIGAHINVGRTLNHLKRFQEAENAYLQAKALLPKAKPGESYQTRIAPNHLNVFLNLANLIAKNFTRLEEADLLYRQAISMRADYTQAYINRGDILIKLNRTKEAQEVYERALLYDSNNPDIYYNLGVVLLEQGKASQALAYLDKALEIDPDHELALLNSAILLQELGEEKLQKIARKRLLKLLEKNETNEKVHFNLGMLAMAEQNTKDAEYWFRQAIHLKEDFRSALFNLALLLADDKRPLEAAPFLNQLVKYHPEHIKGLILLGDIYINNIKDFDSAEMCYKRILELDPNHIQGLHNLCVVYVERGRLLDAEICLQSAYKLAPHEDYIKRHLQIVQNRIKKYTNATPAIMEPPMTKIISENVEKTNDLLGQKAAAKLKQHDSTEKHYSTSSRLMNRDNTMVLVEETVHDNH